MRPFDQREATYLTIGHVSVGSTHVLVVVLSLGAWAVQLELCMVGRSAATSAHCCQIDVVSLAWALCEFL